MDTSLDNNGMSFNKWTSINVQLLQNVCADCMSSKPAIDLQNDNILSSVKIFGLNWNP